VKPFVSAQDEEGRFRVKPFVFAQGEESRLAQDEGVGKETLE
jgi:hypothetical protein